MSRSKSRKKNSAMILQALKDIEEDELNSLTSQLNKVNSSSGFTTGTDVDNNRESRGNEFDPNYFTRTADDTTKYERTDCPVIEHTNLRHGHRPQTGANFNFESHGHVDTAGARSVLQDSDNYATGLGNFAKQLQSIQESQDAILADIRMDMEQLQMDNLALRQSNAKLLAEKNHWEKLYHDMRRNAKAMKDHIQDIQLQGIPVNSSNISIKKSSSKLMSLHQPGQLKNRSKDSDSISEKSNESTSSISRRRSRGRMSSSSQVSFNGSTATEETQCDRQSYNRHSSKSRSPGRKSKTPDKNKSSHGCFDFFRKKSRKNQCP